MVAAGLLFGNLKAEYYEDAFAEDVRIDFLRDKMRVQEDPQFTKDYLDPEKRSIANAIQIYFKDGTKTEKIQVDYPVGHKRRREEGLPLLLEKFKNNLAKHFPKMKIDELLALFLDQEKLEEMPVDEFMALLII